MNRKHGNTETDHFRSTFVLKRLFTNKPEPLKPVFNHFAEIKIITMFAFSKTSLLYLLAFGLFLGFMSCDNELAQDAISPDFLTEEEMPDLLLESLPPPPDADPDEQRRSPCFRFVFPIEIRLRNGTIIAAINMKRNQGGLGYTTNPVLIPPLEEDYALHPDTVTAPTH